MHIGIIGLGVVGSATKDGLQQIDHSVVHYDIKDGSSITDILDTEIVYVCVPTNSTTTGGCDVSQVCDVVEKLNNLNYHGIIAIKSTVEPGTTQNLINQYPNLSICFVPEFLREKSALNDFIDGHDILMVGTEDADIFDTVVKCHGNIPQNTKHLTPTEAEIAKYFCNVFNSLRITFANGVYEVCKQVNADYQQIFDAVIKRHNITPEYLRCSEYLRGFGGHCLPKDSRAWADFVKHLDLDIKLFDALVQDNEKYITGKTNE